MQLSPEQQKAIDAQKQQCPFCKIVKGEIPSKKVYEDDKVLAILDINPAAKGHLLVMPKEHYPIMPLIPPEMFEYLFTKTKHLSAALKEGLLLFGDTLFIANGYAAGQQSSHFMLHLIPRETPDGLEFFQPKKATFDRTQTDDAYKLLKHNLPIMLRQRTALYPLPQEQQPEPEEVSSASSISSVFPSEEHKTEVSYAPSPAAPLLSSKRSIPGTYTKESLIALIESNPQLKQLISTYPEHFKQQVASNLKLQKLFETIDLDTIIEHFAPSKPQKVQSQYSMDELVDIVNDNPQLKELLLKQTFLFAEKIQQIPELQEIFIGVDVEELERAVLARDVKQEQDVDTILGAFPTLKTSVSSHEDAVLDSEAIKNLEPHLEIPDTENPAMIQGEDESLQRIHQPKKQPLKKKKEDNDEDEETEQASEQSSDESTEQPEGADLDLISRLHREMSQRK
ncbi:MAG: HIT domain-containing protein [Nanoarchaeota archaeon]